MRTIKNWIACMGLLLVWAAHGNAGALELREKVAITYTSQIGVKEVAINDGEEIREYLKVTGFEQPVPWCAAFVSWCFTVNDVDNPKSAWSPAWFPKEKLINPAVTKPDRADVFGVYYGNLKRIAHVGFVDSWPPGEYFITVEGNTNNNGSREGDGVYKKRRIKRNAYRISRWV